jgi:hypothetical protein
MECYVLCSLEWICGKCDRFVASRPLQRCKESYHASVSSVGSVFGPVTKVRKAASSVTIGFTAAGCRWSMDSSYAAAVVVPILGLEIRDS